MSVLTNRVIADCIVGQAAGRSAVGINLDSLRGSVILSNNNNDALLGEALNVNFGIASSDLGVDGHVTVVTTKQHLPLHGIDVTARIVLAKDGLHGSFGFEIFDAAGKSLLVFPLTAATGPAGGRITF